MCLKRAMSRHVWSRISGKDYGTKFHQIWEDTKVLRLLVHFGTCMPKTNGPGHELVVLGCE